MWPEQEIERMNEWIYVTILVFFSDSFMQLRNIFSPNSDVFAMVIQIWKWETFFFWNWNLTYRVVDLKEEFTHAPDGQHESPTPSMDQNQIT